MWIEKDPKTGSRRAADFAASLGELSLGDRFGRHIA